VDSYLKAQKHTHPVTDGWKDKMEHSNKRLRAERNIYISAGCMFSFVVMCQMWSLIKRCVRERATRSLSLSERERQETERPRQRQGQRQTETDRERERERAPVYASFCISTIYIWEFPMALSLSLPPSLSSLSTSLPVCLLKT
jgi:hypothetical protein